jgi:hypothetical protein
MDNRDKKRREEMDEEMGEGMEKGGEASGEDMDKKKKPTSEKDDWNMDDE